MFRASLKSIRNDLNAAKSGFECPPRTRKSVRGISGFIMMAAVPELFYRFPRNIVAIFSGRNLLWHAAAILLTIAFVTSGGDWAYYCWTRAEVFSVLARPALGLGMLMPVLWPLALLVVGLAWNKRRLRSVAWALAQAAILAYLVTSGYKAITGRRPPPFRGYVGTLALNGSALTDSSHGFQFGFLRGGIFWGWPSGHTTVAFSMAICLTTLYPKNKLVVFCALLYAFYIGLSVSVTIHWFSEFAAGAIIGSVIGKTVGRRFRSKLLGLDDNCSPISPTI
jgi:membrane-associated phospholipid phosphatase